jgi:hypothetical protein
MTTLIRDTFKYFAKFPALDGVQDSFIMGSSNKFTSLYENFKQEIDSLEVHSQIPGISDYVFGVDEKTIKKRIESIEATYLFVDFGNITTEEAEKTKVPWDNFLIAITVATPISPERYDPIEVLLLNDQNLGHIKTIRDTMKQDQVNNPFLKHVTFPAEITPWFARELHNSTGWSMLFTKSGVEMV